MTTAKILATTLATLLLAGCAEEVNNLSSQDGRIGFNATIDNSELTITRGTQINALTDFANLSDFKFGVSAYSYGSTPLADQYANIFFNAEAARNEGIWWTSVPYYWPSGSDKMAFYAYWPYSANCTDGFGVTDVKGGAANEVGPMKLHFKVNTTDISQQQDLMYAVVQNKTFDQNNPVNLNFRHALTAVNFELGADIAPGYIKKIELLNIGVEGDYTVGQGWTTTATGNITLDFTAIGGYSTESGSPLINNNYGALLMIPQSFSNSTPRIRLYINDSDDGTVEANDHNLYKELQLTDDWKAGTTVTYQISTSSINNLHVNSVSYPTTWGTESFSLKSNYDTNESMGVYVVDETGKVSHANVRYYKTASGWTTDTPLPFKSDYKFFAYYPYTANVAGGHAVGDNFIGTTAADFFSDLANSWTLNADQSDKDYFLSRDLQICKATPATGKFLRMDFPMQHHMGLAVLNLEPIQSAKVRFFLYNDENTYYDTVEKVTNHPSNQFAGSNIPCKTSNAFKYFFMAKRGSTPIFSSSSTGEDRWQSDLNIAVDDWGISANATVHLADGATGGYVNKGWYFPTSVTGGFTFEAKAGKQYLLEVWGAQGGSATCWNATALGGKGGYSYGYKTFTTNQTLYIYVGGRGKDATELNTIYEGGYNGGGYSLSGSSSASSNAHTHASGGGATHIATANGVLSSLENNKSAVLIVAGGGGGGARWKDTSLNRESINVGGAGGGTTGQDGKDSQHNTNHGRGGSQTAGGVGCTGPNMNTQTTAGKGAFGQGAQVTTPSTNVYSSGGGGGWYGGGGGYRKGSSAGGGSGYIGGVTDGETIAGNLSFPAAAAGGMEVGHAGAGYARITLLEF